MVSLSHIQCGQGKSILSDLTHNYRGNLSTFQRYIVPAQWQIQTNSSCFGCVLSLAREVSFNALPKGLSFPRAYHSQSSSILRSWVWLCMGPNSLWSFRWMCKLGECLCGEWFALQDEALWRYTARGDQVLSSESLVTDNAHLSTLTAPAPPAPTPKSQPTWPTSTSTGGTTGWEDTFLQTR